MTSVKDPASEVQTSSSFHFGWKVMSVTVKLRRDNVSDHRAGTEILQAEKSTRKSGFECITLLSVAVANEIDLNGGLKQDVNYRSLRRRFPSGDI